MNKKTILKLIVAILLIAIVIFCIDTFRKYKIVREMQTNIATYLLKTNFHLTIKYNKDNIEKYTEYYEKDSKQFAKIKTVKDNEAKTVYLYNNDDNSINTFIENENEKTAKLNESGEVFAEITNYLETVDNWQTFRASILSKVRKEQYMDKDCYVITNFMPEDEKKEVYIEKDTGLCLKAVIGKSVTEFTYEFDNVKDEVFTQPDISDYKVQ